MELLYRKLHMMRIVKNYHQEDLLETLLYPSVDETPHLVPFFPQISRFVYVFYFSQSEFIYLKFS